MAELNDLKEIWNSQEGVSLTRSQKIEAQFGNRSNRLRSKILTRDIVESVAAGVLVVPLSIGLFYANSKLEWWGILTLLLACCVIPLVLWWGRRQTNASLQLSFVESLEQEIAFLQRQVFLLSNVYWWYILPIYAGVALMAIGVGGLNIFVMAYLLNTALLCEMLRLMNVTAAEDALWPALEHYQKMRNMLNHDPAGNELDDDQLAMEAQQLLDVDRPAGRHWKAIVMVGGAALLLVLMGKLIGDRYDVTIAFWLVVIGLTILMLIVVGTMHLGRIAKHSEKFKKRKE